MSKKLKLKGELIFNFILIIFFFMIVIVSLQIGFGTLKKPGSGLFPFLCGGIIFSLNIFLVLKKKWKESKSTLNRNEVKNFMAMIILFILWVILMPFLGYVLMTFICTFSLSKVMKLEGWKKPLTLSVGTTGLCYFLFDYCLYLDLPRGFLG